MLNNINTRKKLLLFPLLFTVIVIVSVFVYVHYNNIATIRNNSALSTEHMIQQILKGRISAYQFLRLPNEKNAQTVQNDFAKLNQQVYNLKNKLSDLENKKLSDEIIMSSEKYIEYFNLFSVQLIK
jgi:methyl-accepting chemotaxis protein